MVNDSNEYAVYTDANTLCISGTVYTVKRAAIAAASSGNNTLVAAVAGKKIRVVSIAFIAAGAVSLYFDSASGVIFGGSTNKMAFAANGGICLPHNQHGWFQTSAVNEDLRVNLSGAVAISGGLTYIEV